MDETSFEARHIMKVSGHKSETSIRSYAHKLLEKKKRETLVRANGDFLEQHVFSEIGNTTIDQVNVDAASPCDPINTAVRKPQEYVALQTPSY